MATEPEENSNEPQPAPKLFISYSWTNQAHIDWVMQLATDLRAYGVDTVIDRWDLREGQDAHSFMEQSVRGNEIQKTILVCDRKYVERANERQGGVGAESQVVTAQIYKDVEQTKFAAVVTESNNEGEPTLPNFLTSRIFFDFRHPDDYVEKLQQLVRWVFDKPLYRRPEVGPRPNFIDEQIDFEPIRLMSVASIGHNSSGGRELIVFLEEAERQKAEFPVEMNPDEANDESIYRGIKSLPPIINQILKELDEVLVDRELNSVEIDQVVSYLAKIYSNYDNGPTNWSSDVTKFFGQFLVTSILSRLVKFRRFDSAKILVNSRLLKMNYGGYTAETRSLKSLNTYLKSLEARNTRLSLRRASLHADIIREVCELVKIDFVDYMQADLVLYLSQNQDDSGKYWWPDSLIYAADSHGAFPWFARAIEPNYRDGLMSVVGVTDEASLQILREKIDTEILPRVRWSSAFSTADVRQLANLDAIAASYG